MASTSAALFFVSLLALGDAHKILVYQPKFAVSHVNFMGRIADILAEEGHNVTALVSEIKPFMHDGTKLAHIIRVPGGVEIQHDLMTGALDMFEIPAWNLRVAMTISYIDGLWYSTQCRKLLSQPGLVEMLRDEKYDAIITENFDHCGIGLSHLIQAKSLVTMTSFPTNDRQLSDLGAPRAPSYQISLVESSNDSQSFWKMYNMYLFFSCIEFLGKPVRMVQAVYDDLYPGMPSLSEIHSHAAVSFVNSNPLTDVAAPTLNKIVPIGGIAVIAPKPLEKKWLDVLALRKRTALVSFGSIAKSAYMKPLRKNAILNAFAKFPDTTFIWKYEELSDDFAKLNASKVPNVILSEWMPQNDLLADPRIALFITHGGIASCHEASYAGVPVVVVPIFGDQPRNAGTLVQHGNGINFSKFDTVHQDKIADAVGAILDDSSYAANAKKLAEQLRNPPISPRRLLTQHVEYAARFGPSPTSRPKGVDLNYVEYFNIDIFAAFAAVVTIVLFITFRISKNLFCLIARVLPVQKEKEQYVMASYFTSLVMKFVHLAVVIAILSISAAEGRSISTSGRTTDTSGPIPTNSCADNDAMFDLAYALCKLNATMRWAQLVRIVGSEVELAKSIGHASADCTQEGLHKLFVRNKVSCNMGTGTMREAMRDLCLAPARIMRELRGTNIFEFHNSFYCCMNYNSNNARACDVLETVSSLYQKGDSMWRALLFHNQKDPILRPTVKYNFKGRTETAYHLYNGNIAEDAGAWE